MSDCNNKIKHTCGTKNFATCIEYQGIVSDNTTLIQTSCLDAEDVIEDLYAIVDIVKEEINLSSITSDCDTLPTTKTVLTLIGYLVNNVCIQKAQIDALITQNATQAAEILALQENICN